MPAVTRWTTTPLSCSVAIVSFAPSTSDRTYVAAKLLDAILRRPDHLQPSRVHLIERNLAVHRGVGEFRDLGIAVGEDVDAFDRDERGVDVEEDEAVAGCDG